MQVAPAMSAPSEEYCVYVSVKIDAEVLKVARAAASLDDVDTQDYISDVVNAAASKRLGHKPVKRKPPKPRARP